MFITSLEMSAYSIKCCQRFLLGCVVFGFPQISSGYLGSQGHMTSGVVLILV